jgi:hypothetical protein
MLRQPWSDPPHEPAAKVGCPLWIGPADRLEQLHRQASEDGVERGLGAVTETQGGAPELSLHQLANTFIRNAR